MKIRQAIPTYGHDLLKTLDQTLFSDCIVFCAPEAWELVRDRYPFSPREVAVPLSMEQSVLEARIERMPRAAVVFGIGGGSACDAAKMYALVTGARLVLAPTILSVDAPFTKAVGVRVQHRVRYVGEVFPERLLIDFDLIRKAPSNLNRAGVGDILSIHTALFDWKLAARTLGEDYDERIVAQSQKLFDRMIEGGEQIRACTQEGLRLISELYVGEVALCERFGNSRPEEGSEHYLAYCLESITKRSYVHGELIAMAVMLTALYQGQPAQPIAQWLQKTMVRHRPEQVGVTYEEIERALLYLAEYLSTEPQLLYGIYHHKKMNRGSAGKLIDQFKRLVSTAI